MMPLALDLSRLFWRAGRAAPGGIDRLELAMALHLLEAEPTARFVFTDGGRIRDIPRPLVRRIADGAALRWAGHPDDAASRRAGAYLDGRADPFPPARPRLLDRHIATVDLLRGIGASARWRPGRLRDTTLDGAAYLNLSHRNLDDPRCLALLSRAARVLCYLHDDIPLRSPAFAPPGAAERFRRLLHGLAALPVRIVTNSAASRDRILGSAAREGLALPRPEVVPPPIAAVYRDRGGAGGAARRLFLVPGLVTGRKNLGLLAEACRRLPGAGPFDILLAGAPGLDAASVLGGLGQVPPPIRILRAEGLTDHAMRRLMRGAVAVLAASLDEGFDYPVQEALAAGVPVLASDIPAHRETAGGFAGMIGAPDAAAWAAALAGLLAGGARWDAARAAALRFAPPSAAEVLGRVVGVARG
jgi:glycosyltransferase involved in cell wall biosynthesis